MENHTRKRHNYTYCYWIIENIIKSIISRKQFDLYLKKKIKISGLSAEEIMAVLKNEANKKTYLDQAEAPLSAPLTKQSFKDHQKLIYDNFVKNIATLASTQVGGMFSSRPEMVIDNITFMMESFSSIISKYNIIVVAYLFPDERLGLSGNTLVYSYPYLGYNYMGKFTESDNMYLLSYNETITRSTFNIKNLIKLGENQFGDVAYLFLTNENDIMKMSLLIVKNDIGRTSIQKVISLPKSLSKEEIQTKEITYQFNEQSEITKFKFDDDDLSTGDDISLKIIFTGDTVRIVGFERYRDTKLLFSLITIDESANFSNQ